MAVKITTKPQWHQYEYGVRVMLTIPSRKNIKDILALADGDDDKFVALMTDFTINDWEGLVGDDNQPLPVNMDNKSIVRDDKHIGRWIEERINSPIVVVEEEIKNS